MFSGFSQKPLVNLIGFKLFWWAAILYQEQALPFLIVLLGLHLLWHSSPRIEATTVLALAIIGFMIDSLLTIFGWFHFPESSGQLPPVWLFLLWMGFISTLTTNLPSLQFGYWRLAFLGAVAGVVSYGGAMQLAVVDWPNPNWLTLSIVAFTWFLLLPIFVWTLGRFKEFFYEQQMV